MGIEWKNCFKIGASVFLLYLCIHYWSGIVSLSQTVMGAAFPLLLGCVIAYLVNILMSFYEQYYFPKSKKPSVVKSRRIVCMIGAMFTLVMIVALVIRLIFPQLISCVQLIFAQLPGFVEDLIDYVESLNILPEDIIAPLEDIDWKSRLGQVVQILTSGIGSVMDMVLKTISSVFSGVVTGFLSLIFAIYLLLGKDRLKKQCKRVMRHYLPKEWYKKIYYVLTVLNECFHRYIVGQCLEAVVLGGLCTVGMWLLRLPYATMIGALVAFTALIPVAGAYIGGGVGTFMIFMVSPVKAIIFLVFIVVLQQLEGNLIYPRVVGTSLGLPSIWVLAAVTVGGGIMGIAGMLLGVPLTATVYRIVRDDMNGVAECRVLENKQSNSSETEAGKEKTGGVACKK